jgi:hypothetical protein
VKSTADFGERLLQGAGGLLQAVKFLGPEFDFDLP